MAKRTQTWIVGRYRVSGEYEAVPIDDAGELGMTAADFGRLSLEGAIAVFCQDPIINGDELRFARKALGLRQPDLAALLDVASETVSRWETGADAIRRQTQLAILLLLEHKARFGQLVPLTPPQNDSSAPVRIVAA